MSTPTWTEIISSLVQHEVDRTGKPVAGAKLRALLARTANELGVTFPPWTPPTTFAEFIASTAPKLKLIRQRGSDFLVLPPERAELILSGPSFHIRKDLYEALTSITDATAAYYDTTADRVLWIADGELALGGLVGFQRPSFESEKALRESFAAGVQNESVRQALLEALKQPLALREFSKLVVRHGILQRWHAFRSDAIRTRLDEWAKANHVPWKDAWLVPRREQADLGAMIESAAAPEERAAMLSALQRLSQEELRRISLPLDVVAKLLKGR